MVSKLQTNFCLLKFYRFLSLPFSTFKPGMGLFTRFCVVFSCVCIHITLNGVIILDVILCSIVTRVMGELRNMWV